MPAPSASPEAPDATEAPPRPLPKSAREPWGHFLRSFFHIGINSFGGPVAQIGVMHQEAVEKRRWLTDSQFVHLLNFANVLPGPEALEIAIHLGWLRRGVLGGILGGLLFIWPGFVSLTALGWLYAEHGDVTLVQGVLHGIRPVAVALIAAAVLRISMKALQGLFAYALLLIVFALSYFADVPFVPLLLGAGLIGIGLQRVRSPSLGQWAGRWKVPIITAVLLGALGVGFLERHTPMAPTEAPSVSARPEGPQPEASPDRLLALAWVNTKAALVTFGGAYTALPLMREELVARRGWLTDAAVADALALGETTPGPLICFGVFLSYLSGGLWGALVGTFFLFLPSFVLVLAFGRYAEAVSRLPGATAFLRGVSAGTVGLILALSARLVPANVGNVIDGVIAAVAFVALWRFKANILLTVAVGALIGLGRTLIG